MLFLSLLATCLFAIDFSVEPKPGFVAGDYVVEILNRIPFSQARVANGVVRVTGPVNVDTSRLDSASSASLKADFARVVGGGHDMAKGFDLSGADLRVDGVLLRPGRPLVQAAHASRRDFSDRDFDSDRIVFFDEAAENAPLDSCAHHVAGNEFADDSREDLH